MVSINIELDDVAISNLAKDIDELSNILKSGEVTTEIANVVFDKVKKNTVDADVSNSTKKIIKKKIATISQSDKQAVYYEYGTGYIGEANPHPESGVSRWDYDINKHGSRGWYYYDKDNNVKWTNGQIAHMQMYKSIQDIGKDALNIVNGIVKGALG